MDNTTSNFEQLEKPILENGLKADEENYLRDEVDDVRKVHELLDKKNSSGLETIDNFLSPKVINNRKSDYFTYCKGFYELDLPELDNGLKIDSCQKAYAEGEKWLETRKDIRRYHETTTNKCQSGLESTKKSVVTLANLADKVKRYGDCSDLHVLAGVGCKNTESAFGLIRKRINNLHSAIDSFAKAADEELKKMEAQLEFLEDLAVRSLT